MILTLRSKTRYEAMRWQPTQEVYDEFEAWLPGFFDWEPGTPSLVVVVHDDGTTRTELFVQPDDWVICERGTENIWKMFGRHFHDGYEVIE